MKLALSHSFKASPERIYAALIDPAVLQACLAGCEKMQLTGPDAYDVELSLGLAGLKGRYTGKVRLSEKNPPGSLTLEMEGKGLPGFVRGAARLTLTAAGSGTTLQAEGDVSVGGVIAAVGSRLIEAAAKKIAGDFFAKLDARS